MSLDPQKVAELKQFIQIVKGNPQLLHSKSLDFFKAYLESLGATIPAAEKPPSPPPAENVEEVESSEESVESDVGEPEPDEVYDDVIEPESDPMPELAPPDVAELTDEQQEKQVALKQEATDALEDGNQTVALDKYTEAIKCGAPSALMYTRRAEVLLKLKRPQGAIQDCTEAIRLNPDSGKAYKTRGKAYRLLGKWNEAHQDLETGQKIDYDEDTYEIQKVVADRWKSNDEKRKKYERRVEEHEKKQKIREMKKRKKAAQREYNRDSKTSSGGMPEGFEGMFGGMPGGMGGMPGMGGMGGMPGMGGMGGMPGMGGMGGMPGMGGMGGMPGGMGGMGGMPGGMGGMGGMPGGMPSPETVFDMMKTISPEFKQAVSDPQVESAAKDLFQGKGTSKYPADVQEKVKGVMEILQKEMAKVMGSMGGGGL